MLVHPLPPFLGDPLLGFSVNGRGEVGGRGSVWNLGNARGPFTVKKGPLFDENAF